MEKLDTVQNRAIRLYLGVHRFTPNKAVNADMGWTSCRVRRYICMLRLWNRLVVMSANRITRKIFDWDRIRNGWCTDIKKILNSIGLGDSFDNCDPIDIMHARDELHELQCISWSNEVQNIPKLRTYIKFKQDYAREHYVVAINNRGHRSALAQFRCGVLPLSIETGRFMSIPANLRLCNFCDENVVEDEVHFILYCSFYCELRNLLLAKVSTVIPDFISLNENEKMCALMGPLIVKHSAEFIYNAMYKRRKLLYRS